MHPKANVANTPILGEAPLQPGDILVRQRKDDRAALLSRISNLYFTHAAVYTGGGHIIEATNDRPPADQIAVRPLSATNWKDETAQWAVFRPTLNQTEVDVFLAELERLAKDDRYQFHLLSSDPTSFERSCANLISYALYQTMGWKSDSLPTIITPDRLVIDLLNRSADFELFASNVDLQ